MRKSEDSISRNEFLRHSLFLHMTFYLPRSTSEMPARFSFRHPNATNLHVHGMHVSPSAPADDVYTILNGSGAHRSYVYPLGEDLPGGLFWYHPHAHGASALQQSGGMAGPLLLTNPREEKHQDDLFPPLESDTILLFSNVEPLQSAKWAMLAGSTSTPPTPFHIKTVTNSSSAGLKSGDRKETEIKKDERRTTPIMEETMEAANDVMSISFMAVNGQHQPTLKATMNKAHRLRLVSASVRHTILLVARPVSVDAKSPHRSQNSHGNATMDTVNASIVLPRCTYALTAADGVPLRYPRSLLLSSKQPLLLAPGSRKDLMIQCDCGAGGVDTTNTQHTTSYTASSNSDRPDQGCQVDLVSIPLHEVPATENELLAFVGKTK